MNTVQFIEEAAINYSHQQYKAEQNQDMCYHHIRSFALSDQVKQAYYEQFKMEQEALREYREEMAREYREAILDERAEALEYETFKF